MSTTGAILSVLHTLRVPRLAYKRFVLRVRKIVDEAYPSYMDAETLRLPFADESGFLGVMAVCRRLVNWEHVGFDPDYIDAETGVPGERAYLTFGDFANELTQAMMTSNLVPYGSEDIYGTIVEFVLHLATVYARVNLTYQAEREMALQLVECLLSRNAAMPQRLVVPVPSIPGPGEQGHSEGVPLRWPVREGRPVAIVEGNPAEAQGYPFGVPIGHTEAEGSGEPQPEEVEEVDEEPAEEEVEQVDEEPAEEEVEQVDEEPAEEEVEQVDEEPAEEEVEQVDEEPAEEEVEQVDEEPAEEEVEEETVSGEPMDADTIRGLKRNRRDFSYEDEASRAKKASDRYGLRDTPARVERLSRLKEESKSKRKGDNEPGTSATRPRKRFRE